MKTIVRVALALAALALAVPALACGEKPTSAEKAEARPAVATTGQKAKPAPKAKVAVKRAEQKPVTAQN